MLEVDLLNMLMSHSLYT